VVGAPTRVVRLCSKLRKVEQIGVVITHAATRMRLLGNASNDEYKKLLQQIFPTPSTDRLVPLLSDTKRSEMRTYGLAKQLTDMRKTFLDGYSKSLDHILQQIWEGETFARRKDYLQLFDSLQQSIELMNILEKDTARHNQAYSAGLSNFRKVFSSNQRLVQIVGQGFHSYCQTDPRKYLELQKAPKNLENFAISFVRQQDFTENMVGAYRKFATSPIADPASISMMRQHISEPPFAYKRRQAMKAFAEKIVTAKQEGPKGGNGAPPAEALADGPQGDNGAPTTGNGAPTTEALADGP
jgi:hypothetical protein